MKYALSLVLVAGLFALPAITGCDREVAHEKTVKTDSSGGQKVEEKTVTENPDGTMNKTTETRRTNP